VIGGQSATLAHGNHVGDAARRGFCLFPVLPGDKRPAVDRWEQRACNDPDRVVRYWPSPRHNVGIACGPSRLVVIDLDCHGDLPADWQAIPGVTDGRDVFAQLLEWAGQPWPVTYWTATPTGGWHLVFRAPDGSRIRNSAGQLGPSIDVRAAGGYVLGAGSVVDERAYPDKPALAALVKGGKAYEVLDDTPPAPLPAWLYRSLTPSRPAIVRRADNSAPPAARLGGLVRTVRDSQPGDRTGPLVWAAHRLAEMISEGNASPDDGELLVEAAVAAGIGGGERYARYQVTHVLGGAR